MGPSLGQRTIMLNKQLFLKTSVLYEATDSNKPNTVVYLYEHCCLLVDWLPI